MKTTALPGDMAAFNSYYFNLKRSASLKKMDFKLSKKTVYKLNKQRCYYCGCLPKNTFKSNNSTDDYTYNGLDRIDNNRSIGYKEGNIIPCCGDCNQGRGNRYSVEEYKIMINALLLYRGEPLYEYKERDIEVPFFKTVYRWNLLDVEKESKKYKTRNEWKKKSHSSYNAARKEGIIFFDKCCNHMIGRFLWTEELIFNESKKYKNQSDWLKQSNSSIQAARKIGYDFFNKCCKNFNA